MPKTRLIRNVLAMFTLASTSCFPIRGDVAISGSNLLSKSEQNGSVSDFFSATFDSQGVKTNVNQGAFAQPGRVGAYSNATADGSLAQGPGDRSVQNTTHAVMDDSVTISGVAGTPEVLRVAAYAGGSVQAYKYSQVQVSSLTSIGVSQYYTTASCSILGCVTANDLSITGGPLNSVGPSLIVRKWDIPISALTSSGGQIEFRVALDLGINLFMVPFVEADGTTLTGSAAADWAHTAKVGGFEVLDSNFNVLTAKFTSDSGHDYTQAITAVPEPASFSIMGVGLGLLALCNRSRRV